MQKYIQDAGYRIEWKLRNSVADFKKLYVEEKQFNKGLPSK